MTDAEILVAIRGKRAPDGSRSYQPLLLLLASIAGYLAIGAYRWSLARAILLVVALFIHECGHLVAMRLYRYKNLKMMFIPFLGAVATGRSDEHDATRIALIALFGPLFGLGAGAAAIGIAAVWHVALAAQFGFLSVLLNAFNLAPIVPLDGGHFLGETLFARHPRAELGFRIAAVVALFAAGALLAQPVLAALGAMLLISLRATYRMAVALNRLRAHEGLPGGELTEVKVAAIRAELVAAVPPFGSARNERRLPPVIAATWGGVNKVFPGPRQTVALVLLYAVVCGGVVPLEFVLARRATAASNPAVAANTQGIAALSRGDAAAAAADFSRAIALAPGVPQLYVNRGEAEFGRRDYERAVADLDRGISGGAKGALAYFVRGLARFEERDAAGAADDLTRSLALNPNNAHAYVMRGEAELELGRTREAGNDFNDAIRLDPKAAFAWRERAEVKDLEGDFAGEAADYGTALKRLPTDPFLRFRFELVLRRLHRNDGPAGLREFVPQVRDARAKAIGQYLLGKLPESMLLKEAAAEPGQAGREGLARALYYAGMNRLLAGQPDAARRDFSRCLATIPASVLVEARLAGAELARLGAR